MWLKTTTGILGSWKIKQEKHSYEITIPSCLMIYNGDINLVFKNIVTDFHKVF